MTENLLPDMITPVTAPELYAALRRAWPDVIGPEPPMRAALLVLLGHSALECGWWHYVHRFNLGNVKHVQGDGHDYVRFSASEIIDGKPVFGVMPFVAFADIDSGAAFYLKILHGRFGAAWPAVLAGDPVAFCHELKLQHYYTADEAQYTRSVVSCVQRCDGLVPPDNDDVEDADTDPATPRAKA